MISAADNLNDFFRLSANIVNKALDRLVPSEQTEPERLHRAIRWSLFAGGKRFRPSLILAVGQTFGAETERFVCTAAAVEMIHTYSLIHDDLPAMDNDDLRRGRATCHIEFGEATAILAGDALYSLAFEAIAEDAGLDPLTRVKLVSLFARAAGSPFGMVAGQQFDLEAEGPGKPPTVAELERIHKSKTGALIAASAEAGALIAGASPVETAALGNYAAQLGLLFQVTDDLLDVTQPTEVLGKTAAKDISAEKATYPVVFGVEGTRELAADVYRTAITELGKINRDTALLNEIAGFILRRSK